MPRIRVRVGLDWPNLAPLQRRVAALGGRVLEEIYGEAPALEIELPEAQAPELQAWHQDATRGAGGWEARRPGG